MQIRYIHCRFARKALYSVTLFCETGELQHGIVEPEIKTTYLLDGSWKATLAGGLNPDAWFFLPEPKGITTFDRMLRSGALAEAYFRNVDIQPP